jgi:hypothetical protein
LAASRSRLRERHVRERRTTQRGTILEAGDEIGVGDSRLVFRVGPGATAIHPVVEPADPAHRPTADAAGSRDLNEQRRPARAELDRTPAQTNARQGPVQPDARPSIELFLAVAGSVCGALIANALSNTASPTVRLTGAVLGAGVPPLITIAGPWRRLRVSVGIMVAIGALVITYFGATLFDYARGKTETFPLPAAMPKPDDPDLLNRTDADRDNHSPPGDCDDEDASVHPGRSIRPRTGSTRTATERTRPRPHLRRRNLGGRFGAAPSGVWGRCSARRSASG